MLGRGPTSLCKTEVLVLGDKNNKERNPTILLSYDSENILQISANLVTTAMVGRLLANDIAAQGICKNYRYTLGFFIKELRSVRQF